MLQQPPAGDGQETGGVESPAAAAEAPNNSSRIAASPQQLCVAHLCRRGPPAISGTVAEAFKHSARSARSVKECSSTGLRESSELATTCRHGA